MSAPDTAEQGPTWDEPVGVIGLGAMGRGVAENLADAGLSVFGYDVSASATAAVARMTACASVAEVAARAPVVLLSLPDGAAVLQAVGALLPGPALRTVIDLSTCGPAAAVEAARRTVAAGRSYVDAPVSGGPRGARAGTLAVMAAGDPSTLDSVRPLLALVGQGIRVVGSAPGDGQLAKVVNNLLSASAILVTAEALTLGVKAGLDPDRLLDVINASSGRNTATADKFPKYVLSRSFDFGFRLDLMRKDIALCVDEAARQGVPMPVGSLVRQLWQLAENALPAGVDCTAIAQLVEGWSDVTLERPA